MNNFEPTATQRKAFLKVVMAMKIAKKLGLHFYGKSDTLVAYNEHSATYVSKHGFGALTSFRATGSTIPHLSGNDILDDSGADDYPCFNCEGDNPDNQDEDQ